MTTLQKTVIVASLAAAVGTGIYALNRDAQLSARIQTLQAEQAPLAARIQQLEQERHRTSNQVAALSEENAQLKSRVNSSELLKLRGEVGVLRQRANSNQAATTGSPMGLAKMMNDPSMRDFMMKAMQDKLRSMYGDLIKELNLTPEQADQFVQLISGAASKELAQLTAPGQGTPAQAETDASPEMASRLQALLGDTGSARFKEFSEELPARTTLTLLNDQLGEARLTGEQTASLMQIIKAEPAELTRGILGSPDKAFLGSQSDIDTFLQQVAESNARIVQKAAARLNPDQLATLDSVLTKGIEARKLQGAAFFQKR